MKKKCFAALALIGSLALLTACGGSSGGLDLTANWHKNTGTLSNITGTQETLEYAVTFVKAENAKNFYLEYDEGTYTTTLSYKQNPIRYVYTTELNITGRFYLNGAVGKEFTDHLKTETEFLPVDKGLQPVQSVTESYATCPLKTPSDAPASLQEGVAYNVYDSVSTTTYNEDCTQATITTEFYTTDKNGERKPIEQSKKEKTVKIKKSPFFDNNEIVFAMRGFKMSKAESFYSIDPQTNRVTGITMDAPKPITWDYNGAKLDAYQVSVRYTSAAPGPAKTLVYAKASDDANNNVMRNVPLRIESPVSYSHGTLVYNLKSHQFGSI